MQPFDLVRVLSAWWVAVVAEGWWTEARGQQQYDSMDMAHVFRYQGLCMGTFVGSFYALFLKYFYHDWVLNFVGFFCISWDDHVVFLPPFILLM